jgi:ABC-type transport system substrate-binding protein
MDEMQVVFYKTDQPMWLEFKAGNLDFAQVPAENFKEAFNKRTRKLTRDMTKQGMTGYPVDLLDFIFFGFNMEDSVLGGYTEEKKALRQAFCLAMDWEERNDAFYNGINVIYDGVIPPGLEGHPKGGSTDKAYRGPNLERAREMLAKAGYPEGKGLPIIDYYVARSGNGQEQSEMLRKQLAEIGITLQVHLLDFSQVMQKVDEKSAQFFSFAWGSDYPDGENNLALFYGPNEAPGANHFNYKNAEYDRLYQQIVAMPPSAERTQIYETMQGMLMEDCPYAGSMARTRFYVVTPRLKQFKPVETFDNWYKYLDVDK